MTPSKIQIRASEAAISPCATSPQLMPFHIKYSGPAPIATFFRVRELKEETPSAHASSSASQSTQDVPEDKEVSPPKAKSNIAKRLVAAFRGRRVVGVDVPLPEGYTGLILQSDAPRKATKPDSSLNGTNGAVNENTKGKRKASTRGTRRSKPIEIDDEEEDANMSGTPVDEMDVDPSLTVNGSENEGEVKTLRVTQTFQSLVVWNADVAVDEGKDEYIRAIREWTAVAAEVHRMED